MENTGNKMYYYVTCLKSFTGKAVVLLKDSYPGKDFEQVKREVELENNLIGYETVLIKEISKDMMNMSAERLLCDYEI